LPNKVPQSEAAETLNIGDRSLRYANQVIQSGTPELIKAVDDGKVAANMRQGERTDLEPSTNSSNVISQSEAVETLNIGDRSLRYANQVIESGTPELIKAVDDGKEQIAGLI